MNPSIIIAWCRHRLVVIVGLAIASSTHVFFTCRLGIRFTESVIPITNSFNGMLLYSIMPWMQCTAQIQNFLVVPKRQKRDTYRNEQNSNHNKRSIPKQLARAIPWFTVLSYECLSLFFLKLVTSSLLFEIRHVGGRDGLSIEFQSTQGTDLSPVVVFHKEGDALDALIFHVLQQYIVGVFFQILAGHFDRSGRIDVLNVFESEVVAIDKEQDACWLEILLFINNRGSRILLQFSQENKINSQSVSAESNTAD